MESRIEYAKVAPGAVQAMQGQQNLVRECAHLFLLAGLTALIL
jgi:hypothetical protein